MAKTSKLAQIILDDAKNSIKGVDFSELKNKTVLITGASGITGTYFLAGLTKAPKVKIYAVCQSQPEEYWEEITQSLKATIIRGDLCDDAFIEKLPRADFIIHAAGYGQPGKFMMNPLKTIKLNTAVTLKLLEKLKTGGKFLFISTSEVYSGLKHAPFKENQIGTTNTDHPRSCYIEAKCLGEAIVFSARAQGISAKSARASLGYGPGARLSDKRVLHSFINRALSEGKIDLMDDGSALRTYCYITDTVQTMWNILLKGKENIYNVGGTSRTTIENLAKLIGKVIKVPVNIPKSNKKTLSGAPEDVRLDLNKIKKEFGKKDFVSLENGVKKTISWQKELYNL